jgi:antirestriction protein ArdC
VKKVERSSIVTFWKIAERHEETEDEDAAKERRAHILRYYHVFNVEQCEGIEAPLSDDFEPKEHEPLALCEGVMAGMPQRPDIKPDPRQAF